MTNFIITYGPAIVTAILAAFLPWFIPFSYRLLQEQKLSSLNKFLTCDYTPFKDTKYLRFIKIHPALFFLVKILALIISATFITILVLNYDKPGRWFWTAFAGMCIAWGLYAFLLSLCKKETKGLVGIISHEIRDVEEIPCSWDNHIFFATHYTDEEKHLGLLSYEERQPILEEERISQIRKEVILPYYTSLKAKIEREANNGKLFYLDIPEHGTMHICDFMLNHAYTTQALCHSVHSVSNDMRRDSSINFIGDKVGVEGFSIINGKLMMKCYLTDHFTFKVFKHNFKNGGYKEIFQVIIRRLNKASMKDKDLLIGTLKFLFSSFGLDMIVYGEKADGEKGVLIAIREGKIESHGQSKIHVPVNESFSFTDIKEGDKFCLKECAYRGIEEELGIEKGTIENGADVCFTDFAVVSDEGEIGLGCHVDISGIMPLEEACLFPGQDKFLELKELFVVKFPPFKWNPEKYKDLLYNLTKNPIFTTPWESFTPLLYQRLVVREATLSRLCIDTISVLTIIAVAYIMLRNTADDAMRFIIEQAITFGICIITYIVIHLYRLSHRRRRYKLYKPLVPQWNGDATVMQSINIHLGDERGNSPEERDPVISYMMFGLNSEKCETVALDSLRMENEPWCAVRRELKKNRAESPINFYLLRHADSQLPENMLKMMQLGVRDDFDYLYVDLHCEVKGGRKKYSFTTELKDMRIDFGYRLSSRELECYSAFFGVSPDFLKTLNIGHFTKDFCNMYELRDFFKYRDNYYWSVVRKHNPDNGYTRILMDKSNDMYKEIEKVAVSDGVYHLTFYGKHDILIPKLADFIDHGQNRTRIESLDIYMLQLILARMVHNSKHLMLVKKKPVNIIRHILQPLSANSR